MASPALTHTNLARRHACETESAQEAPCQYLTFSIGTECFAVPIESIREVVEFSGMTEIPMAPPAIPGVINLRGAVVPVVDLSVRLGRHSTEVARRTCIVVVEAMFEDGLQPIGVIVDAVSEAIEVVPSQMEPRPAFGSGMRSDFVSCLLKLQQRFVVVLDMKAVLSVTELEQLSTRSTIVRAVV